MATENKRRDDLVKAVRNSIANIEVYKADVLAKVYPGIPDVYVSGSKADLWLELKLMPYKGWVKFQGGTVLGRCLPHEVLPSQESWLALADRRFVSGTHRHAALAVFTEGKTGRLGKVLWAERKAWADWKTFCLADFIALDGLKPTVEVIRRVVV